MWLTDAKHAEITKTERVHLPIQQEVHLDSLVLIHSSKKLLPKERGHLLPHIWWKWRQRVIALPLLKSSLCLSWSCLRCWILDSLCWGGLFGCLHPLLWVEAQHLGQCLWTVGTRCPVLCFLILHRHGCLQGSGSAQGSSSFIFLTSGTTWPFGASQRIPQYHTEIYLNTLYGKG
jgi:hypothetical protein